MSNRKNEPTEARDDRRVRKVIVLGGGSAGYLAAIALKIRMPELSVTVIHSKAIPIIGVGEGTTFTVPIFLHGYLGLDPAVFHRLARPTYKLGIRFLWGPRERFHYSFTNQLDARLSELPKANGYFAFEDFEYGDIQGALMGHDRGFERQGDGGPLVTTGAAYHIENREFVAYLEKAAAEAGVVTVDDEVAEVETGEEGVSALRLKSGQTARADLFVDCSGFRSELIGKALGEPFESFRSSLFCDRAVAGGWRREDEPLKPYTTAETMECGWAWQIEHDELINRGYVYSSAFVTDEEAEREFRGKNPKVKETRVIRFDSGAYRRCWIKNVVGMGNASGFVEPLEATSLSVICDHTVRLIQALADADMEPGEKTRHYYNQYTARSWSAIRRFLAMHYKFNTRIDNAFWKACQETTDLAGAEEIVEYYQECGPSLMWAAESMGRGDPFGWEGYLIMLVGQRVPHRNRRKPTDEERAIWLRYREGLATKARNGLGMAESLAMIRSDHWAWKPDFYQNAVRW
jgi:tryptophan 7-halogenase